MLMFSDLTPDEIADAKSTPQKFFSAVVASMVTQIERTLQALQIRAPDAQVAEIQVWVDRLINWANPPEGMPPDINAWGSQGVTILHDGEQLLLKYLPRGTNIDTNDLHALLDVPGSYPAEVYNPVWSSPIYQAAVAAGENPGAAAARIAPATADLYPDSAPYAAEAQARAAAAPVAPPVIPPVPVLAVTPTTVGVTVMPDGSTIWPEAQLPRKTAQGGGPLVALGGAALLLWFVTRRR